jgi:xylan 1,4-beta-xylosidase
MAQHSQTASESVNIEVDLNQAIGDMYPLWAWWGYDEPNYTYMANGRKLLTEISELSPVSVYVRAHSMLNTDEGPRAALKWGSSNVYTEDEDGNPQYDWSVIDRIVDTWVERDIRPLMEIGFMPKALSSNPEPYRHDWEPGDPYGDIYTGWAYPPNDYEKWAELVYQWVRHSVERYGKEEVETWYWQVWNEPNIDYWQGTKEEFFKLHDYTADAVKRALPTAKVGGPHTPGPGWDYSAEYLEDFLEHCQSGTNYVTGETGSPLDFIAFHAKGSPSFTDDGHVRMSMASQLNDIESAFEIISSFSELNDLPVIIGESDPEGCAACARQFGYPENDYRNGTMYSSYTAASFARKYELADQYDINLAGAVSWSFQFEDQPWFAGFRSMATNGINKPVLNIFRMFGMMDGDRVEVSQADAITAQEIIENGVRGEQADIHAFASRGNNSAGIMVWNYHDDDVSAPDAPVTIDVEGVPANQVRLHHYRVDEEYSNAYTTWREMGAPQQVTDEQYEKLESAGQLKLLDSPKYIETAGGTSQIQLDLPRQGVSFLILTW